MKTTGDWGQEYIQLLIEIDQLRTKCKSHKYTSKLLVPTAKEKAEYLIDTIRMTALQRELITMHAMLQTLTKQQMKIVDLKKEAATTYSILDQISNPPKELTVTLTLDDISTIADNLHDELLFEYTDKHEIKLKLFEVVKEVKQVDFLKHLKEELDTIPLSPQQDESKLNMIDEGEHLLKDWIDEDYEHYSDE